MWIAGISNWRRETYMSKTEKMFSVLVLAAASVTLSLAVAGCNSQPAQDNTAQNQTATQPATGDQAQNPEADANLAVTDAPADNTAANNTAANNAPPSNPAPPRQSPPPPPAGNSQSPQNY